MTIIKKPNPQPIEKKIDDFVDQAPDAKPQSKQRPLRGKRVVVSATIWPELLDKVDNYAHTYSLSRNALINLALEQLLRRGADVKFSPAAMLDD